MHGIGTLAEAMACGNRIHRGDAIIIIIIIARPRGCDTFEGGLDPFLRCVIFPLSAKEGRILAVWNCSAL